MKLKDLYEVESRYEILDYDDISEAFRRILNNKKFADLTINKDDEIRILDENFVVIPFSRELLKCEVISKGVKIFSYGCGLDTLSFKVRILKNF